MKAKSTIGEILYKQAMVDHQAFLTKLHPDFTKTDIKPQKRSPDFANQTPIMSQQPNINKEDKKGEGPIWKQVNITQEV
jgi:hypothetical protein